MKQRRRRRAGATETFSVSVDPRTKRALRALADDAYGGNLSALVTDLAEEARRRMAAGAVLKRHGTTEATTDEVDDIQRELEREVRAWKRQRRPKGAA